MPHLDHEKYRDRRLRRSTEGDLRRKQEQAIRYRPDQIIEPRDRWDFRPGIDFPPGFQKSAATLTFAPSSSNAHARYIGRAIPRLQAVEVMYRITAAGSGLTYAEFGLAYSENLDLAASLSVNYLTTLTWADVATAVTTTGRKVVTLEDFAPVNHGAHLWVIVISQGTTPPTYRAGVPQECGLHLSNAGARPSVGFESRQFDEVATTTNDLWLPFSQIPAA